MSKKQQILRYPMRLVAGFVSTLLLVAVSVSGQETGPTELLQHWDMLFDVTLEEDSSAYAVGTKGLLLRSEDGGRTWQREQLPYWENLYSLEFEPKGVTGWIVGEQGLVLITTDSGRTWSKQETPTKSLLFSVTAVNSKQVRAVGADGTILRSDDGGETWQVQAFQQLTLFDVSFANGLDGWAIAEFGTILRTKDGGVTWAVQAGGVNDYQIPPYFATDFQDPQNGLVVGMGGVLLETSDAGASWSQRNIALDRAIYAVDLSDALWLAGAGGLLIRRDSEGDQQIELPTFQDLTSVAFKGTNGLVVGYGGTLLHTNDGGQNWAPGSTR